jgi:hypothetical protein
MKTAVRLVVSFFATLVAAFFHQQAVAVTTNLTAIADTGLWAGAPDHNLGKNVFLPIGTSTSGHIGRGLVRFDLSAIPTNATISSATLTLKIGINQAGASTVNLHRMLQGWIEGTGNGFTRGSASGFGSAALAGEPTWNRRASPGTTWGVSGGSAGTDFVATATATTAPAASSLTFSSAGLTADVQLFVSNPTTNSGWLFKHSVEGSGGARRISMREDTLNAPKLLVNYTVATPAMPPTIFGEALVGNAIRFSFIAQSNLTYAVEALDTLGSTNWTVLTSIAAQPADTVINLTNTISSSQQYFRVRTP